MKKRFLLFILLFTIILPCTAEAKTNREIWMESIAAWADIMETDGNWVYRSGSGEIADYKSNREKQRYTNCALMISHALQYMGVFNQNQKLYAKVSNGAIKTVYSGKGAENAIRAYCDIIQVNGTKDVKTLLEENYLQEGDIVCFYGMQHTVVYVEQSGNFSYWYDAGRGSTDTKTEGGHWNKEYPLKISRDSRYLEGAIWMVNEIIRFRENGLKTSKDSSPKGTLHNAKNDLLALTGIQYKIKGGSLYVSYTIKNRSTQKRTIKSMYLLGTKNKRGTGKSARSVKLGPGKTKTYRNVLVSSNKVSHSRNYLSLQLSSRGSKKLEIRSKIY